MLGEFVTSAAACKELLEKQKLLVSNQAVDDLDLSALLGSGEQVAASAFGTGTAVVPTQVLASKGAYDYVVAHSRLHTAFSRTRNHYYRSASGELDKDIARIEELSAVLQRLELHGGST